MPLVAIVTIALGAVLALALVAAVSVILAQLRRTSSILADIDGQLAAVPPGLSPLVPTAARINAALAALASSG